MNKELKLLSIIEGNGELSQRELAKELDVSLGTVNNMIQTFEKDDVLKVNKITSRKVKYFLTDKGYVYKNRLYVDHISSCFDVIASVRSKFKQNLNQLVDEGHDNFYIQGDTDELIRLVKMCFFEISRRKKVEYSLLDDVLINKNGVNFGQEVSDTSIVVGWETNPQFDFNKLKYKNLLG